ncbi:MAG: peptidoglycan DD-metalloendopeptidase family protein [Nostoc sp. DedVER02]|uniref:peptidoglycan DD-metalloendopeptidase family protein n=1 Tax=unclassified Nostoc TaxID=2593658 RepID=UPI002AD57C21|nr:MULTISPECIES: peptidoglycan DD-metalloendopeptidase family protein [unclassified Nostoc]MDZ7987128.1 peptidoglycan DD-metalloendopeptidase family protein [Nostoc sp. DedVER02]MDZ8111002.1 peptidoglycan DD-metalloendopeptidase family protein [Nostoc sp. DedVER01b]
MSQFNINNPNSSQQLLDPFIKITIGAKGSTEAETFTLGDGKLIKASVTLGEGKAQSSCNFTVYDPQKTLTDKFYTYVESVGGLDPVTAPKDSTASPSVTSITNSIIPTANAGVGVTGKVLFDKTKATVFNDTSGSRGNTLYPDRDFGCAMRYNNPAAAKQFGSQGMFTDLKFGDKVKVTNLDNGKSVICDIQDWGPNPSLADRGIDLFTKAFNELTNTQGYQAAYNIGILTNIKVELVENSTTTSTSSTSNQTKEQVAVQQSTQVKNSQISSTKINDWPAALLPATKSIIVVPGHIADGASSSGTNGTATSSVTYKGESRTLEFVVNDKLTEMLLAKLPQAGYTVVAAPTVPTGRSDAARRAYQDAIKTLKEQTGAYAFEIHCDEPAGRSGVIPGGKYDRSGNYLSVIDVALANEFGAYSFTHRQALSAPSRGITILEVTNLGAALTSITQTAVSSGNYQTLNDTLLPIALKIIKAFDNATSGVTPTSNVASSVAASQSPTTEVAPIPKTLAGAQVTVEMGYGGKAIAAYSFIHTGLKFSLFEPDALEFSGTAATVVLTQIVRNTVYTNLTFKKIAQKITSNYGMKLEMPEDGPLYTRFPQRGITDYEALLIEARRIGYRVHCVGPTLYIGPRKGLKADQNVFVLEYGTNMGVTFTVSHQAQTSSSGGARSSKPGETTSVGERKFEVDPDTGVMVQKKKESVVGTGGDNLPSTTGAISPIPAPTTTGATDTVDSQRVSDENRIKGILAQAEFPTTPEALTLDPDTLFQTKGVSKFLDRMWVIDTITHTYSGGSFVSRASCYSPLKNKSASSDIPSVKSIGNPVIGAAPSNAGSNGFDPNAPQFIRPMRRGVVTSKHRSENPKRPNHKGVDISSVSGNGSGSQVLAAAAGTASVFLNSNTGYGNYVDINHGGGWLTRYAHLYSIGITNGQQVTQGQIIGIEGNSGNSRGTHLHFEVRLNNLDLNPLKFVPA